jgi:hypothetical protein
MVWIRVVAVMMGRLVLSQEVECREFGTRQKVWDSDVPRDSGLGNHMDGVAILKDRDMGLGMSWAKAREMTTFVHNFLNLSGFGISS